MRGSRRLPLAIGAVVVQLVIVVVAVAPQLSARALGSDVTLRVAAIRDGIDGHDAYVELAYPDLPASDPGDVEFEGAAPAEPGTVFVPLTEEGGVWVGGEPTRARPDAGRFLRCDDRGWRLRCGIESWFLPAEQAGELERSLGTGEALATVRVDGRGNAALVDVRGA